jgi:hypothetical protein
MIHMVVLKCLITPLNHFSGFTIINIYGALMKELVSEI